MSGPYNVNDIKQDLLDTVSPSELAAIAFSGGGLYSTIDSTLLGNNTDETSKLQSLLNEAAGGVLVWQYGLTVKVTNVTFPDNLTVVGDIKLVTMATSGSAVIIGSNSKLCGLDIKADATGVLPVKITGSSVRISKLNIYSLVSQPNQGIIIGNEASIISDVSIDKLGISGFDRACYIKKVDKLQLNNTEIKNFYYGAYIVDLRESSIRNFKATGESPSDYISIAGSNGLLVEATSDFATYGVSFDNIHVEDSCSHAIRVGGQSIVSNISFSNVFVKNPGYDPSALGAGGSGIKVLGPSSTNKRHKNIYIDGLIVEDTNITASTGNRGVVYLGCVSGATVSNVMSRAVDKPESCGIGLILHNVNDVHITNPIIEKSRLQAIRIYDSSESPGFENVDKNNSDITITGGRVSSLTADILIQYECRSGKFNRVNINELTASGGKVCAFASAPTGSGSYDNCNWNINYSEPTATDAGPPFRGQTIMGRVRTPYYGSFSSELKNGSLLQGEDGTLRVRKLGSWFTL